MVHMDNKELLVENLEYIKDMAIENHDITDEIEIANIELIFMELCDYWEYINFNTKRNEAFSKDKLEEFLDFYVQKTSMSSIVTPKDAEKIINLLFDLDINII